MGASARSACVVAWLASVAACTCNDPQALNTDLAARVAEPHLAHFASFERWAHRTASADTAFDDRAELKETLFAPIRRDAQVEGAWLELEEGRVLSLHGAPMPDVRRFIPLRHDRYGDVRVGRLAQRSGSVAIGRRHELPRGPVQVVVAYRPSEPSPSGDPP